MALVSSSVVFSDVNLVAGTNGNYELVTNEHSINQNIMMIVSTPIRSKWWRPNIGTNLDLYLFEPIDEITSSKIQSELKAVLADNLETRVQFEKIEVIPDVANQNYYVNVEYVVPALEGRRISFEFTLGREA